MCMCGSYFYMWYKIMLEAEFILPLKRMRPEQMFNIFPYFIFSCFSLSPQNIIFLLIIGEICTMTPIAFTSHSSHINPATCVHPSQKNHQVQFALSIYFPEHDNLPVASPLQKIEFSLSLQPARNHPLRRATLQHLCHSS